MTVTVAFPLVTVVNCPLVCQYAFGAEVTSAVWSAPARAAGSPAIAALPVPPAAGRPRRSPPPPVPPVAGGRIVDAGAARAVLGAAQA